MADRYASTGVQTVIATPGATVLTVIGLATHRGRLYEVIFSQAAVPADNIIQWLARRFSAAGTGTAVTPAPLDSDAPAALLTSDENHTVEPTYTAGSELLDFDLNQRATFRFVAAPGGELVVPATAAEGIGITPISAAYAGDARVTAHWEE